MKLTDKHAEQQAFFAAFIDEHITPHADRFDHEERIPREVIERLARESFLGAFIPAEVGGSGFDTLTQGLLCEEVGRAHSSLLSLLVVHGMVGHVLARWGTLMHKERYLARLATGAVLGAFALTEPEVGSDAANVQTRAEANGEGFLLNGIKTWISFAQLADLLMVVARLPEGPAVFLVEVNTPGVTVEPINGVLGFRAAMLGRIILDNVRVPADVLVGRPGFGFSHVAGTALDLGRYAIAWGCVGLAQACVDAALHHANSRKQFGKRLMSHQLIQGLLADMVTQTQAARALCYSAGLTRAEKDPAAIVEVSTAKYFAARTAMRVAQDAVQIHGAQGCAADSPVQRYYRDAKIMEIIEGSNQVQQMIIARYASIGARRRRH
jgi:glutaryl-CoA dehydrogenase (non-decarboxylating)